MKKPIKTIGVGVIISTALKLDASYEIEWIAGWRLWDYSHWPPHFFQGRISLSGSLLFGVFSLLVIGIAYPLIEKWVEKIPAGAAILLDMVIVGLITADAAAVVFF